MIRSQLSVLVASDCNSAIRKLDAGASLIQLYSSLVYMDQLPKHILYELKQEKLNVNELNPILFL